MHTCMEHALMVCDDDVIKSSL